VDKKKNYSKKELLAMGKPTPKLKKKVLFKDYCSKYCNLGMANRDSKTMRKELPAIAKRGAYMIMKSMLKDTRFPGNLKDFQKPFISIVIHAGIMEEIDGKRIFIYPSSLAGGGLEEV